MYYILSFLARILYFIVVILLWCVYAICAVIWLFSFKRVISLKKCIEWASEKLEGAFEWDSYSSDYDYFGY